MWYVAQVMLVNNPPPADDAEMLPYIAAAEHFDRIATDTTDVMAGNPEAFLRLLPAVENQTLRRRIGWMQMVFQLAWLRLSGSPLRAHRSDKDFREPAAEGDNEFVSVLPLSPFDTSVAAIDILLNSSDPPPPPQDDPGKYSRPDTPKRLATMYGVDAKTFKKYVENGTIRAKKLSDRSYMVHVDDLPSE